MKVLLHICCGPCAIYPVSTLIGEGAEVTCFFFNHNIHPYQEYQRRRDAAVQMAEGIGVPLIMDDRYLLEQFLANVASAPDRRCGYCYSSRLDAVASAASLRGFDAFSSSLFYSRYQNHDLMKEKGGEASVRYGIPMLYRDFRTGWQEGIRRSKGMGLYRQQYCGCIYSEKDRYLSAGNG